MSSSVDSFLVKGLGKEQVLHWAEKANSDSKFYSHLMDIVEQGEMTPAMKASWILGSATVLDKKSATKHQDRLLSLLLTAEIGGVQRELLKSLFGVKLKTENEGVFINHCFELLIQPGLDLAVKYYCIKHIKSILKHYPDLKNEFYDAIATQREAYTSSWQRHVDKILLSRR